MVNKIALSSSPGITALAEAQVQQLTQCYLADTAVPPIFTAVCCVHAKLVFARSLQLALWQTGSVS